MTKFEFHFYTSFINYFNKQWVEKCSCVPTLIMLQSQLASMLKIVNEKLNKYE